VDFGFITHINQPTNLQVIKMKTKQKGKESKSRRSYSTLSQRKIKAILRDLPLEMSFHFYEEIGKPTGQVATSLLDFCSKLASAQSLQLQASLVFHMKRGDFATWIKQAVGDRELADKIKGISADDHNLAEKLHKTVDDRIKELKETTIEYSIIPEDRTAPTYVELAY
jgi:hypothetical protein